MELLTLVLLTLSITYSAPIYLSQVFRHGARYPVNDLYDGKSTKDFHGNLTSVGLREHYLLGSYIAAEYSAEDKLFSDTLKPREVQFFTLTDTERCIESAYAHALGMFQFYKGQTIDLNIDPNLLEPPFETIFPLHLKKEEPNDDFALQSGFQPTPIRYGDNFFPYCDNMQEIFTKQGKKIEKSLLALQAEFLTFSQRMAIMFKLPLSQIQVLGLMDLYDTLVSDKFLGRAMPERFTDQDFHKFEFINRYIFGLLYEGEPARIFNEPYMKAMLNNMELVINGKLGVKKLSAYSVHDANIVPLMLFLNLTSTECIKRQFKNETVKGNCAVPIPFASNLLFELHKDENTSINPKFYVKVRYNGEYFNLCEKDAKQCEFYEFAQRCKRNLMDFNKYCNKNQRIENSQNFIQIEE